MDLGQLLSTHKDEIIEDWLEATFGLFPDESLRYLKKQKKNVYQNPLSHRLAEGLENLFTEMLGDTNAEALAPIIDKVIKVTSVQEGQPSKALTFLFLLKKVVRKFAEARVNMKMETVENLAEGLIQFDKSVDQLIRMAFDIYVKCREEIYQLKVEEQKIQTHTLIQMVNKNPILENLDKVCS